YDRLGVVRERIGNRNPGFAPAGNFLTRDGRWLQVAAGGDRVWARMAEAIGRPELATDERFATQRARAANADELEAIIRDWIAARDFDDAFASLDAADVPAGPIMNAAQIVADPHINAREDIVSVDHPRIGPLKMPGIVPKFSATPGAVQWPGPELGEHNAAVYGELLGMNEAALRSLHERGVL
ncbi:MAG TPA: CoA transferase, partial [Dehalococcoidia bacterium]